jgi:hypothetical protein
MRIVLLAALVGGCSTITTMEVQPPRAAFTSTKAATELEGCIARSFPLWGTPSVIRGRNRTALVWQHNNNVIAMVTLRPQNGATAVEYRGGRLSHRIQPCL